jgi:hypothetical protein
MRRTIDLVLPVNPASNADDRRMRICLSSLRKYLDPASVGRLLIVVPDRVSKGSVEPVTWEGQRVPFASTVLHDSELLGSNIWRARIGGWYVQQFVKLSAADQLESDFYVTLDSDVVLTRPTCFDDLVTDGRAATTFYRRDVHANWWRGSAALLGTDPKLADEGMGVTPAVLSTRIARALMRHLEMQSGGPWYRAVVECVDDLKAKGLYRHVPPCDVPTEYTLYYLFAEMQGWVSEYHVRVDTLWCEQQVFGREDLREVSARLQAASRDKGRFLVIQSALRESPEWVWSQVSGALRLAAAGG